MKRILPEFSCSAQQYNLIKSLAADCKLTEETVKILYGRGIDSKEKINKFINPSKSRFISPFKMQGMQQAVELLTVAKNEGWTVAVYGDYDADGICAATIMAGGLKDFGINPVVFVPERKNGYGLSVSAIDEIFEEYFPQLFITVDCGISNAKEVEYIKEQGAEVIVTDHHELPDDIPDCICINPKFDDGYPYDNLCGAGVAFKVACALNGETAYKYLDFAAIATVADSVPLLGENRDIVYEGLKIINNNPQKCYSNFLGKNGDLVTAQSLAFSIAPKINAAGRMGDAYSALKLFSSTDDKEIYDLSVKLTAYNQERQKCCDELYLSAKQKLKQIGAYGRVIMLWDENWNSGFVGIVAARLTEEYGRPTLLFVKNGDMLKGSARSIENVNIFEALKANEHLISEFGGHAQAAGVNITIENFNALEEALNEYLNKNYTVEAFIPTLYVSGTLNHQYSPRFAKELEMLEPYGIGNRRPLFLVEEEECTVRPVKPLSPHVSIKSSKIELMYFGGGKYLKLMESAVPKKFIFEYNVSRFRGREYIKGYVKEIIYNPDCGVYAKDAISLNNVLTYANSPVPCKIEYKTSEEINQMMFDEEGVYGTVFIANEYKTLSRYNNANKFGCEIFTLSSKNLANVILISPQADVDLSGFKRVIYLDYPPQISIASLMGKNICVCSNILGYQSIENLNTNRNALLSIFSILSANAGVIEGGSVEEVASNNNFNQPAQQVAFALKVFEQLSLISFNGGKLTVYKGVKTNLTASPLYTVSL
ncbi:MAG: single-stranded-DNA-specific exonuclease RecJ, partial [Clostridiales bacterium]|nr:single-stranded-DNA-specific exonuclease RecJ [Clostridiales bacterium]